MKPTKLELDVLGRRVNAALDFTRDMFEGQHLLLGSSLRELRGEVFEAFFDLSEAIEEMQMRLEEEDEV